MNAAASPNATTRQFEDALLTMDVVDQIRHHQAALAEIAANDETALKARLSAIYKSQGIDVSDAVLRAGIKAQREKRFIHKPYTGPAYWLARGWIYRATVALRLARAIGVVGLVAMAIWLPREAWIHWQISSANEAIALVKVRAKASTLAYLSATASLTTAVSAAASAPHPEWLSGVNDAAVRLGQDAISSGRELETALTEAKLRPVTRATVRDITPLRHEIARLDARATALVTASAALSAAADTVAASASASTRLETANATLLAGSLSPEMDRTRETIYASGVEGLLSGRTAQTQHAVERLASLVADFAALEQLRGRVGGLYQQGMSTSPSTDARKRFESLHAQVIALLTPETFSEARGAMTRLEEAVHTLSHEFTYRVVNRPNVRSGVWRHNSASPNARNYYLIVEALDEGGRAVKQEVRNEESGRSVRAAIFGVRVSESAFNSVAADKQDNGIIERDVIGSKPRGAFDPTFTVAALGGYITEW
ncbi:hypothetical protein E4T66_18155 [Sinimarinibacterium sp. CAU 1509]|uniref:DUF6384 family protein n=1 Tax=Sinimarinibacterium sp. CAU 1509 TaxID=2562283 RepID=UPI0010ABB500|nr:DUF6384 family protein [Sinimarinibacterium sp. CAU 1509]TJY57329.1 hypothetical protein E4T66_18155 [Sinimarinibacterium sp. CAU 1509]